MCTPAERARIEQAALETKRTLSDFCRMAVVEKVDELLGPEE